MHLMQCFRGRKPRLDQIRLVSVDLLISSPARSNPGRYRTVWHQSWLHPSRVPLPSRTAPSLHSLVYILPSVWGNVGCNMCAAHVRVWTFFAADQRGGLSNPRRQAGTFTQKAGLWCVRCLDFYTTRFGPVHAGIKEQRGILKGMWSQKAATSAGLVLQNDARVPPDFFMLR